MVTPIPFSLVFRISRCTKHLLHYLFWIDMETLNAELLQCPDPEAYVQKLEKYYQSVSTAPTVLLPCCLLRLERCFFRVRDAVPHGGYLPVCRFWKLRRIGADQQRTHTAPPRQPVHVRALRKGSPLQSQKLPLLHSSPG